MLDCKREYNNAMNPSTVLQNAELLEACANGKEDVIESILNHDQPELNVASVDEAGLSSLHYAVKNGLRKGLSVMTKHATFTLAVIDKVS